MDKRWEITLNRLKVAFMNFVLVAIIGVILRLNMLWPIEGMNYSFVLHGHSHLAFLGWVFMAIYAILCYAFLPREQFMKSYYRWFFICFQLFNIGMISTFPFTGYALFSIIFSALHAVLAIVFSVLFIRDTKQHFTGKLSVAYYFIFTGLLCMILSNVGPFLLGAHMAINDTKDHLYHMLVYFYLHFQYNGFFTFIIIGLMLWLHTGKGKNIDHSNLKMGFYLKAVAIAPSFALSSLWMQPGLIWYIIGGISALAQLIGILLIIQFIYKNRFIWKNNHHNILFGLALTCLFVQHLLQMGSSIPDLASLAFSRNIVIGYLHLVMIGSISGFIIYATIQFKMMIGNSLLKIAVYVFIISFIFSELLLISMGGIPRIYELLLIAAMLQLVGVGVLFFNLKPPK